MPFGIGYPPRRPEIPEFLRKLGSGIMGSPTSLPSFGAPMRTEGGLGPTLEELQQRHPEGALTSPPEKSRRFGDVGVGAVNFDNISRLLYEMVAPSSDPGEQAFDAITDIGTAGMLEAPVGAIVRMGRNRVAKELGVGLTEEVFDKKLKKTVTRLRPETTAGSEVNEAARIRGRIDEIRRDKIPATQLVEPGPSRAKNLHEMGVEVTKDRFAEKPVDRSVSSLLQEVRDKLHTTEPLSDEAFAFLMTRNLEGSAKSTSNILASMGKGSTGKSGKLLASEDAVLSKIEQEREARSKAYDAVFNKPGEREIFEERKAERLGAQRAMMGKPTSDEFGRPNFPTGRSKDEAFFYPTGREFSDDVATLDADNSLTGIERDVRQGGAKFKDRTRPQFRVAFRKDDGTIVLGKPGESHSDLASNMPEFWDGTSKRDFPLDGFADEKGNFYTRGEVSEVLGQKSGFTPDRAESFRVKRLQDESVRGDVALPHGATSDGLSNAFRQSRQEYQAGKRKTPFPDREELEAWVDIQYADQGIKTPVEVRRVLQARDFDEILDTTYRAITHGDPSGEGREWYSRFRRQMSEVVGEENISEFSVVWAILSPQNPVESNLRDAMSAMNFARAYDDYLKKAGKVFDEDEFAKAYMEVLVTHKTGNLRPGRGKDGEMLSEIWSEAQSTPLKTAKKIAHYYKHGAFQGDLKTKSFNLTTALKDILGGAMSSTNDVRVGGFFGSNDMFEGEGYLAIQHLAAETAREVSEKVGHSITTDEVQAIWWFLGESTGGSKNVISRLGKKWPHAPGTSESALEFAKHEIDLFKKYQSSGAPFVKGGGDLKIQHEGGFPLTLQSFLHFTKEQLKDNPRLSKGVEDVSDIVRKKGEEYMKLLRKESAARVGFKK